MAWSTWRKSCSLILVIWRPIWPSPRLIQNPARKDDARRERLRCLQLAKVGQPYAEYPKCAPLTYCRCIVWVACILCACPDLEPNWPDSLRGCHSAQAATEPRTPMGRALELPGSDPALETHPKFTFHRGAFATRLKPAESKSTYSVTDGTATVDLADSLEFRGGAQTWVLENKASLRKSGELLSGDRWPGYHDRGRGFDAAYAR